MRIPRGVFQLIKEAARHLLRRPVVGVVAVARTPDGRYLLVRRTDLDAWALPGGTLEWGETLRHAIAREVQEETGSRVIDLGSLVGVTSDPARDPRFHAVTVAVAVTVEEPMRPPDNPAEISEARLFAEADLPADLAHGMGDLIEAVRSGRVIWE